MKNHSIRVEVIKMPGSELQRALGLVITLYTWKEGCPLQRMWGEPTIPQSHTDLIKVEKMLTNFEKKMSWFNETSSFRG